MLDTICCICIPSCVSPWWWSCGGRNM